MSDKAAAAISLIPAEMHHALTVAHAEVARLRLTDAERESVERAAIWLELWLAMNGYHSAESDDLATLRALLERHAKGGAA